MTTNWGTLARGQLFDESLVRQRSFGLLPATHFYNEQAAPGIGSLWFVRKLYPCLLALYMADCEHGLSIKSKLRLANAIEAYSCYFTLKIDEKARFTQGRRKFKPHMDDEAYFSCANLLKPSAYVSAPFRQSCSASMVALKLVQTESARFNQFSLSALGLRMAQEIFTAAPKGAKSQLKSWIQGEQKSRYLPSAALFKMDDPPHKGVCRLLEQTVFGQTTGEERIRSALRSWFDDIDPDKFSFQWNTKPSSLSDEYWKRLHEASSYTAFLNSLRDILSGIEQTLNAGQRTAPATLEKVPVPEHQEITIADLITRSRQAAHRYLNEPHSSAQNVAVALEMAELVAKEPSAKLILRLCSHDRTTFDTDGGEILRKTERSTRFKPSSDRISADGWCSFGELPQSLSSLYWLARDLAGEHEALAAMKQTPEETDEEGLNDD